MSLKSISLIDYVVLACRDLEAARRFYAGVMGFPVTYERPDWIRFQAGPVALALRPEDGFFSGRRIAGPPVQLAFQVGYGEVDACHRELEMRGVPILEPPADQSWGHRTVFFSDPEENVLEIYADIPGASQP